MRQRKTYLEAWNLAVWRDGILFQGARLDLTLRPTCKLRAYMEQRETYLGAWDLAVWKDGVLF